MFLLFDRATQNSHLLLELYILFWKLPFYRQLPGNFWLLHIFTIYFIAWSGYYNNSSLIPVKLNYHNITSSDICFYLPAVVKNTAEKHRILQISTAQVDIQDIFHIFSLEHMWRLREILREWRTISDKLLSISAGKYLEKVVPNLNLSYNMVRNWNMERKRTPNK